MAEENPKIISKALAMVEKNEVQSFRTMQNQLLEQIRDSNSLIEKSTKAMEKKSVPVSNPAQMMSKDTLRTDDDEAMNQQKRTNLLLEGIQDNTEAGVDSSDVLTTVLFLVGGLIVKSIGEVVKGVKGLWSFGKNIGKWFKTGIMNAFNSLKKTQFWKSLSSFFQGVKARLAPMFKPLMGAFNTISKFFSNTGASLYKVWTAVKPIAQGIWKAMGTAVNGLMKVFGVASKFFKAGGGAGLLKGVTAIARIGGRLFLPLTILLSVIDGIKGAMNAVDIFGEDVNIGQRISSIVGHVISGLTFGLIDPKNLTKNLYNAFKGPINAVKALFDPEDDRNMFVKVIDVMGEMVSFMPGLVWNLFKGLFGGNPEDDRSFFGVVIDNVRDFIMKVPGWIGGLFGSLFSFENEEMGMFGKLATNVGEFILGVPDMVLSWFGGLFSNENPETSMFGKFGTLVMDYISTIPGKMYDIFSVLFSWEKGGIFYDFLNGFGSYVAGLPGKIWNKVTGIFSSDENEQAEAIANATAATATSLNTNLRTTGLAPTTANEVKARSVPTQLKLASSDDPNVRMKIFSKFLLEEFSTVLAKKIATANADGLESVRNVKVPSINPFG